MPLLPNAPGSHFPLQRRLASGRHGFAQTTAASSSHGHVLSKSRDATRKDKEGLFGPDRTFSETDTTCSRQKSTCEGPAKSLPEEKGPYPERTNLFSDKKGLFQVEQNLFQDRKGLFAKADKTFSMTNKGFSEAERYGHTGASALPGPTRPLSADGCCSVRCLSG
jgi:hypothetical protein